MDAGTAAVVAAAVTSGIGLVGIIWQSRKTRSTGTGEHLMAQQERRENRHILETILADVRDVKAEVRDVKQDVRSLKLGHDQHDADIAALRVDHDQHDADIAELRSGQ